MARTGNWGGIPPKEDTEDRARKYTYNMKPKPRTASGLEFLAQGIGAALKGASTLVDMRRQNAATDLQIARMQNKGKSGGGGGKSKGSPVYVPIDESQRVFLAQGVGANPQPVEEAGPPPPPEMDLPAGGTEAVSPKEDQLTKFNTDMQRIKTAVDQGKISQSQARTIAGSRSRELTVALGSDYVNYHDRIIESMKPITGASMMAIPRGTENSTRVNQQANIAVKLGIPPQALVGKTAVQIQDMTYPYQAKERQLDLSLKELQAVEKRQNISEKAIEMKRSGVEGAINAKILNQVFSPLRDKLNEALKQASAPGGLDQRAALGVFTQVEDTIRQRFEQEWYSTNESTGLTPATAFKDKTWEELADRFIKSHVKPFRDAIMSGDVNYANVSYHNTNYLNSTQSEQIRLITQGTTSALYNEYEKIVGKDSPAAAHLRDQFFNNPEAADEYSTAAFNIAAHIKNPKVRFSVLQGLKAAQTAGITDTPNLRKMVEAGRDSIESASTSEEVDTAVSANYTPEKGKEYIQEVGGTDAGPFGSNMAWGENSIRAFDLAVTPETVKQTVKMGSADSAKNIGGFVYSASQTATAPLMANLLGDGYTVTIDEKGKITSNSPIKPRQEPAGPSDRAPTFRAGQPNYRLGSSAAADEPGTGARFLDSIGTSTRMGSAAILQRHMDKLVQIGAALGEPDPVAFAAGVLSAGRSGIIYNDGTNKELPGKMNLGGPKQTDAIGSLIDQQGITYDPAAAQAQGLQQSLEGYGGGVDAVVNQLQEYENMARQNPNDKDIAAEVQSLRQQLADQIMQGNLPQGLEQGIPVREGSRESMGVQQGQRQPDMRPVGGEGAVPFSQAEPNAPVKTKSGMIVPLSEYSDGSVKLDWDAGVTGDIKKFWEAVQYLASPEAVDNPEKAGYEGGRVALGVALGGTPVKVPAGSLRTFGGFRGALKLAEAGESAPLEAMVTAKAMFKKGASIAEVEQATGDLLRDSKVFAYATKGADGKLRFELSDASLKIRPDLQEFHDKAITANAEAGKTLGFLADKNYEGTLKDILDGESPLFKMYPELLNTKFKINVPLWRNNTRGSFDSKTNTITLNRQQTGDGLENFDLADVKDTIIHEIQHKIQTIEKFGEGGSLEGVQKHIIDVNPKNAGRAKVLASMNRRINEIWKMKQPLREKLYKDAGVGDELRHDLSLKIQETRTKLQAEGKSFEEAYAESDKIWTAFFDKRAEIDELVYKRFQEFQDKARDIKERVYAMGNQYSLYRTLAGEVEARLAGSRSMLEADWLRSNPLTKAAKHDEHAPIQRQVVAKGASGEEGFKRALDALKGQKIY